MKTKNKIIVVAIPVALIAFSLSRVIWPQMPGMPEPTSAQIPFFIFLSILEALSFGFGVAVIIFGRELFSKLKSDKLALASFLTSLWFLVSWWPHDNMHRVHDMNDLWGLLKIEFIFHFTLIIGGFIIASYLWREFKNKIS